MTSDVYKTDGTKASKIELRDELFCGEVKEDLFYEVVKMQLARKRSGNASTKTRSEVSGGGIKPWRQKGTGRARAGSNRSPIWRHGGTVFGPKPRDYSYKVPKRVVKAALKSAIALRVKEGKLKIFDTLTLDEPRTKVLVQILKSVEIGSALIVVDGPDKNLELAARNLRDVKLLCAGAINVYDILRYDELVVTRAALEKIEARIQ